MRAHHDSRDVAYRNPYGAVAVNTPVTLALDVHDASGATVVLRTWIDGVGEQLHEMHQTADDPARYEAVYTPVEPGIVWYHFIVTTASGEVQRYGTADGRVGGVGALRYGEPPSYQLTVHSARTAIAPAGGFNLVDAFPFQEALESYLRNEITAYDLAETVETVRETYPARAPRRSLGLLDHSARARQFTNLTGVSLEGMPYPARVGARFEDSQAGLAKGRLWLASLLEALMPSVALSCRDDAEVEDELDAPCSCSSFPWGCAAQDCSTIARNAVDLCRALPLFESGNFSCFAANADVFGFWRRNHEGRAACVLVNASLHSTYDIAVPMEGEAASELIAGYAVPIVHADESGDLAYANPDAESFARVHLNQLGSAIVYFHANERLGQAMEPGLGVLAHITSLPTKATARPGTLGAPAREFVDWLARAGVRYWQVLPVNPTNGFGSPYAGISAFAGNTYLLEGAPESIRDLPAPADAHAYRDFCERERYWLEPYACFMAIRQKLSSTLAPGESVPPWQEWPEEFGRYAAHCIEGDEELATFAENWRRTQFEFERQWEELRAYANDRGVKIIGDMPIYVSADSSDVWASPELFQLGPNGVPAVVAGTPPDAFAAHGQIWGNPVYDWNAMRASGYEWWLRRLERAFELYDVVRLDHFIGFSRYYSIPANASAVEGRWHAGPGIELFRRAHAQLGPLPIIAEDLGLITPGVRTLSSACGFPGMDIIQFADGSPLHGWEPRPEKVAYTGTHDNHTLVGFCEMRYPELDARETAEKLMETVVACDAPVRILPLQDLIGLDDRARMNVPGTAEGNWCWQATTADLESAAERAHMLAHMQR